MKTMVSFVNVNTKSRRLGNINIFTRKGQTHVNHWVKIEKVIESSKVKLFFVTF